MKNTLKRIIIFVLTLLTQIATAGAVRFDGFVKDSVSGETLPFASVEFKGSGVGVEADLQGFYILEADSLPSPYVVFSYLGYKSKTIDVRRRGHRLNVHLAPEQTEMLGEVVVVAKRKRYKRKENPAVVLMKKVIEHRDSNDIRTDKYSVARYEKTLLGLNDFKAPKDSSKRAKKSFGFLYDYVDTSEISHKPYLPVSLREKVTNISYQNSPERQKQVITAQNNKILMNLISADMIDNVLAEAFADIQLYDNNINMFMTKFVSPLSVIAPTFYHFFITDTVTLADGKRYTEMTFVPANTNDMGFMGKMLITQDSSYAVKTIEMDIPRDIKLNFVEKLHIEQEYDRTDEGKYALKHEKMITELFLLDGLQGGYAKRDAYYNGYKFHDIDMTPFERQENVLTTKDAEQQADTFWAAARPAELKAQESSVDTLAQRLGENTLFNITEYVVRTAIEGYMTLGKHGYVDYGPVMSTVAHNDLEGLRLRVGGRTNPALNKRLFLDGYAAYGFKDEKWKYKAELEYSFRDKKFSKIDFPRRSLMVNATYDWDIPSERFLGDYASSFVHSFKREKITQFAYVKKQTAQFLEERGSGFSYKINLTHTEENPAMDLHYFRCSDGAEVNDVEYSLLGVELGYAPGVRYYQNKTTRYVMNREIPQFTLSHETGLKDVLGSQFNYNKTTFTYKQKLNVTPMGYFKVWARAGKIWDKVPYPMLFIPSANLSYIITDETFWLMNNMEFLTDQYLQAEVLYNMDGFLLGRIPGIRRLRWKEVFRFRALYGTLSDHNNPAKTASANGLFNFPTTKDGRPSSYDMDENKPYMEAGLGIHSIFKLFKLEYIHRLNYLDHHNINKWGVLFGIEFYM